MSRPLRLEYPGSYWHITSRGNARQDIVRNDADRVRFLDLLGETVERFEWVLYAYALMTNHFHLVVELTAETLSSGLHWLKGRYARYFNSMHDRVGHVFQGRFAGLLIDQETYFLEVLRYVVLNPVRAGIVDRPEDGIWTSFPATVGDVQAPSWLSVSRALLTFGGDTPIGRERFRRFVHEGIGGPQPWADLVGQIYLGSDAWIEETKAKVQQGLRSDEHPRVQRELAPVRMADVIGAVASVSGAPVTSIRTGRGGRLRMIAAWIAAHEFRVPLREIAAGLNVRSAGHVSRLVSECDRELDRDESLRADAERCLALLPA